MLCSLPTILFLQTCRVETVRSIYLENRIATSLSFRTSEPVPPGNIHSELHFGQSFASIEPPSVSSLAGFGGASRRLLPPNFSGISGFFTYCLPYTSVSIPPRVKVFIWQGKNQDNLPSLFAIISIDVVAVTADITQKIVNSLALRYPDLNLSQGNVQILASHTHSGPAGLTENPFWSAFACDRYSQPLWDFLEGKITDAFHSALQNSAPVGKTSMRGGRLVGLNKSRYSGMEVDSHYTGLDFWNQGANTLTGCAVIFALHPTWFGQEKRILSADIPGFIEAEFLKRNGNPGCIFLNGAVGNADAKIENGIEDFSSRFVDKVRDDELFPPIEIKPELHFASKIISLPVAKPNLKACNIEPVGPLVSAKILDSLPSTTKIGYFTWGKSLFILFPGEPVFSVQNDFETTIKAKFPKFERVQLLGLANDYLGYVVDESRIAELTLESCSTLYGSSIAKLLENSMLALLDANLSN